MYTGVSVEINSSPYQMSYVRDMPALTPSPLYPHTYERTQHKQDKPCVA